MIAEPCLLDFARDIRAKTLKLIDGASDAEAFWTPMGTANHMLWHAGHAVAIAEKMILTPVRGEKPLPAGFFETFGWNSKPAEVIKWPEKSQIVDLLKAQASEMTDALGSVSLEKLSSPHGDPTRGRTVRWYVVHGLHDEANHQGEMYLLKKLYARSNAL